MVALVDDLGADAKVVGSRENEDGRESGRVNENGKEDLLAMTGVNT
jgi:hypothetical protein